MVLESKVKRENVVLKKSLKERKQEIYWIDYVHRMKNTAIKGENVAMVKKTEQMEFWSGNFGKEYTDRNEVLNVKEWDKFYEETWGISRTAMNTEFIGGFSRDIKVLEVGCNVGHQLLCLQAMGFKNLYGIELQPYAVEKAKEHTKSINIFQGSGFDTPFKDGYFDLVFTSGVLIHISPNDLNEILSEIYRCSKQWIWGFEYFAEIHQEITYRGKSNVLWKGNFAKNYSETFPDLMLIKEKKYPYQNNQNEDSMFLLQKKDN